MDVFISLVWKLVPLYVIIFMGYVAGRFLHIDKSDIARLLFYLLTPIVVMHGILNADFSAALVALPIAVWLLGTILSVVIYYTTSLFFKGNIRNIMAFSSGTSSMGYFGLPVAMMVFSGEEKVIAIYITACVGMMLFENTCGFYWVARGIHTTKECAVKFIKLPTLYAAIFAFAMSAAGLRFPDHFADIMQNVRGAYSVLGMMIVGLSLSTIKEFTIDWKMLTVTFVVKYVLWPILIIGFVYLDKYYINFFNNGQIYKSLMILAIVPISVSNVVLATIFNYPVDRITVVLLINTLIALVYVPTMIALFLS